MRLGTFSKTEIDNIRFEVDYSEWLDVTEIIGFYSFGSDPTGLIMTGAATDPSDKILAFLVGGGLDGEVYNLIITVTTDAAQVRQDYVVVTVNNP